MIDCVCGVCVRCRNHQRYLRELVLRRERLAVRRLLVREREAELRRVLSDFQRGVVGLDVVLEAIEGD